MFLVLCDCFYCITRNQTKSESEHLVPEICKLSPTITYLKHIKITFIFIQLCFFRINVYCLVALKLGVFEFSSPRTPALISDTRPTTPIKYSTSPTSSYLKFSPYDHVHITFNGLWVI